MKLKEGLLLIRKHKNTKFAADMVVNDDGDNDKRLITGEVLQDGKIYKKGTTVIFGKYSILTLTLKSIDYHIIEEQDVLGECDYKED